jgi:hypothetical protein
MPASTPSLASPAVPRIDRRRVRRVLLAVLAVAAVVSVVHYTDNFVSYDEYPRSDTLPNPSAASVVQAWCAFTAFGVAGLLLFLGRRYAASSLCLAVYAGSGLIGIGHYLVPGAVHLVWWRQAHIVLDILCGVGVLAFAVWIARHRAALERPEDERAAAG